MRRLLHKTARENLELVGRFLIGDTVLEVAADKGLMIGLVNGYRVVDAPLSEDPMDKIVNTLSILAAKMVRDSWGEDSPAGSVTINPSEWDSQGKYPSARYMEALVEKLRESLSDETVVVLPQEAGPRQVADRAQRDLAIDVRPLLQNLSKYRERVTACLKAADRVLDRSSVLLARQVSPTMWGSKDLQARLDGVSSALPALEEGLEGAYRAASAASQAIDALVPRLRKGSKMSPEEVRYVKNVLIPDILKAQESVSSYVSAVVSSSSVLSNLDRVVRRITGYPASFMFRVSLIDDLNEAFGGLVSFLADVPFQEKNVFEPLEYIQYGTFSK